LAPGFSELFWDNLRGKAEVSAYDACLDGAADCAKLIASSDATYDFVNLPSSDFHSYCAKHILDNILGDAGYHAELR
jgi:hypothetical protein